MKNFIIGLLVLGLTNLSVAQTKSLAQSELLPEVTIVPRNLTYISKVLDDNAPLKVKKLEKTVASYDVTEHPNYYAGDIYAFDVIFQESNARVIATYDEAGKILKSFERFKNIALPKDIVKQIMAKYPGWHFESDTYLVRYFSGKEAKKYYTVKLLKDNNKVNLKIDPSGKIL
jgi:hypothetical protein